MSGLETPVETQTHAMSHIKKEKTEKGEIYTVYTPPRVILLTGERSIDSEVERG